MKKSIIKILLVENDQLFSATLIKILEENLYTVDLAIDGQLGLDMAIIVEYDLILIDLQIPKLDGISLCRQLRSQNYHKPILLLTADDSDTDVMAGFDAGIDDYISKPCVTEILLARIKTLLRRSNTLYPEDSTKKSYTTLSWGNLCLDHDAGRVSFGDQVITLTATEYNLLALFLQNPDRIFSRTVILDRLWGFDDAPTDRAINTHIKDLRKKIKAAGLTEEMIETVYGMGYRLKPIPISAPSSFIDDTYNIEKHQSSEENKLGIDKLINRFLGLLNQRIDVLAEAKTALLAGNLEVILQQKAKDEAHKLAGSLALFGYPNGSKLGRKAEHLLMKDSPFTSEEIKQFSELVTALQQELAKPPQTKMATTPVTNVAPAIPTISKYRVLVIDDDQVLTEKLKAEAAAWGFTIRIAPDIATARVHISLLMPDIILLDLSFPNKSEDGLMLLQELNQRSPNLPVIIFTGRDSFSDRLAVLRLGARQFLQKPATTEQIFRAVTRILPSSKTSEAKVLLVDDDIMILDGLSSLLRPWGLEVTTLAEPQQFWEVLNNIQPNLVIVDLEMPMVSGLELCQMVRQDAHWENLPVLVVTAHTDTESLQQAYGAGVDDFITKPVLGPELVTRVMSRIERNRRR